MVGGGGIHPETSKVGLKNLDSPFFDSPSIDGYSML